MNWLTDGQVQAAARNAVIASMESKDPIQCTDWLGFDATFRQRRLFEWAELAYNCYKSGDDKGYDTCMLRASEFCSGGSKDIEEYNRV